jgi:hypothetical protein
LGLISDEGINYRALKNELLKKKGSDKDGENKRKMDTPLWNTCIFKIRFCEL